MVFVRGSSPWWHLVSILAVVVAIAATVGVVRWHTPFEAVVGSTVVSAASILLVGLVVLLAWRRASWARFELGEDQLIVTSGPWGDRLVVPPRQARAVEVKRSRSLGLFPVWQLYAPRDGDRLLLATLVDAASAAAVARLLRSGFRDAGRSPLDEAPFARRFGPMPRGVRCEGDPEHARGRWEIGVACSPRERVGDLLVSVAIGTFVLGTSAAVFAVGLFFLSVDLPDPRPEVARAMTIGACLFALAPVLAVATLLRSALQSLVLRWGGDLHLVLEGEALRITTSPRVMREVSVARHATLEARRSAPSECQLVVIDDGVSTAISAPLDADDARYVVALVAAYRAENASPRTAHL